MVRRSKELLRQFLFEFYKFTRRLQRQMEKICTSFPEIFLKEGLEEWNKPWPKWNELELCVSFENFERMLEKLRVGPCNFSG